MKETGLIVRRKTCQIELNPLKKHVFEVFAFLASDNIKFRRWHYFYLHILKMAANASAKTKVAYLTDSDRIIRFLGCCDNV